MTDEDLRWCDVCDDCSHYKAVGDEKYQCTLEGGRCRGYFAYKKLKAENAALRERLEKAMLNRRIYYLASIWNDATLTRRKEVRCRTVDYVCDNFVEVAGLVLKWDEIYFTREAAESRLAELKGDTK